MAADKPVSVTVEPSAPETDQRSSQPESFKWSCSCNKCFCFCLRLPCHPIRAPYISVMVLVSLLVFLSYGISPAFAARTRPVDVEIGGANATGTAEEAVQVDSDQGAEVKGSGQATDPNVAGSVSVHVSLPTMSATQNATKTEAHISQSETGQNQTSTGVNSTAAIEKPIANYTGVTLPPGNVLVVRIRANRTSGRMRAANSTTQPTPFAAKLSSDDEGQTMWNGNVWGNSTLDEDEDLEYVEDTRPAFNFSTIQSDGSSEVPSQTWREKAAGFGVTLHPFGSGIHFQTAFEHVIVVKWQVLEDTQKIIDTMSPSCESWPIASYAQYDTEDDRAKNRSSGALARDMLAANCRMFARQLKDMTRVFVQNNLPNNQFKRQKRIVPFIPILIGVLFSAVAGLSGGITYQQHKINKMGQNLNQLSMMVK